MIQLAPLALPGSPVIPTHVLHSSSISTSTSIFTTSSPPSTATRAATPQLGRPPESFKKIKKQNKNLKIKVKRLQATKRKLIINLSTTIKQKSPLVTSACQILKVVKDTGAVCGKILVES